MKKAALSVAISFSFSTCFSQKTNRIDTYIFSEESKQEKQLLIEMSYAKAGILNITGDSIGLKDAGEVFVDIICTDYPSNLSLQLLNQQRLKALFQRFPFLSTKNLTSVNIFRQVDGAEKARAETMFHGLLVRYRLKQSARNMQADLNQFDDIISTIEADSTINIESKKSKTTKDSVLAILNLKKRQLLKDNGPVKYQSRPYDMSAIGYDVAHRSSRDSVVVISTKTALKKGLITKAAYRAYDWTPFVMLFYHQIGDTGIRKKIPPLVTDVPVNDSLRYSEPYIAPDSTLLKIFARTKWRNFSIVGDVTVSMYPYSAQLLLLLKLHNFADFTNSFVFFNDGDEMPDSEKKTGSTGGIYSRNCTSFEQVKKLIRETMAKGSGGDQGENDVEALLFSEKEFPGRDFQVLIADNRAPVKDMILTDKLIKPVRIVLCGGTGYDINIDYLNLARKTKGSVHLIEQDINQPASLREGEVLRIGRKNYKIDHGSFIEADSADQ